MVNPERNPEQVSQQDDARLTAWVEGHVQGVGFRWWTTERARGLELAGSASNLDDGSVEVIAEGTRGACEQLLAVLRGHGTPGRVSRVTSRWAVATGRFDGFHAR